MKHSIQKSIISFSALTILFMAIATAMNADSMKINKTGTVYQNVKTTTEKGVVTVDFEDGSQKKFRTRDVTVTPSEVVWLAEQKEEPNFFQKLFGTAEEDTEKSEATAETAASKDSEEEEESSIPYLGEGIFGGVALLFLLLP